MPSGVPRYLSRMKNRQNRRVHFTAWLNTQLIQRGYDVTGLRSGGRARFAADSGISAATVGRLLRGDEVKDIGVMTMLAEALGRPLGDILVRAGILDESDLTAPAPGTRRLTPEEAADELGIHDPQQRAAFIAMTRALQPPPGTGEGDLAEN